MTMHKLEEGKTRFLGFSIDKRRAMDPYFIKLSKRVRTISGAVLAPGYHFCPNDYDILTYLKNKNMEQDLDIVDKVISEIDVYNYKDLPGDLLNKHLPAGEQQLYFFSPIKKKYVGGLKINRSTGKGNWRITGEDRKFCDMMMRTLVFYDETKKKTDWMMHEYRLEGNELSQKKQTSDSSIEKVNYVLCKLFEKSKPSLEDGYQARCSFGKKERKDYTDEIVIVPSSLTQKLSELECETSNTSALDEFLMTSTDYNNSSYNVLECTDKPGSFGVQYQPKSSQTAHSIALKDVVTSTCQRPSFLHDTTTDQGGDLGAPDGVWSDFNDEGIINMNYFENGTCGSENMGNGVQNTHDIAEGLASFERDESIDHLYLQHRNTFLVEQQTIHMPKVLNAQPADIMHMPTTSQEMDMFATGKGNAKLQATYDDTKVDLDPFPDTLWPNYDMQSPDTVFIDWEILTTLKSDTSIE